MKQIYTKHVKIQSYDLHFSKTSESQTKQPGTLIGNVKRLLRHKDQPLRELAWHSILIFHLACTFGNVIATFEHGVMERPPLDYSHHPFSQPRHGNTFTKNPHWKYTHTVLDAYFLITHISALQAAGNITGLLFLLWFFWFFSSPTTYRHTHICF